MTAGQVLRRPRGARGVGRRAVFAVFARARGWKGQLIHWNKFGLYL